MKRTNQLCTILMLILTTGGYERELARPSEPAEGVAMANGSVPATCVQGDVVPVVVSVENRGNQQQTCEITLLDTAGGKEIERKSVTLSPTGQDGFGETYDLSILGEVEDVTSYSDRIAVGDGLSQGDGPAVYLADMNRDGFDDVIIGARRFDNLRGRVYIFYGGPDMDGDPDIVIEGHETNSQFGNSIAVGDLNGDGELDLVVGANRFDSYRGRAYLYYGPIAFDHAVDKIFTGEAPEDTFAMTMTARGDVDGDGCDDLLIGTLFWPENKTQRGRVYFYYGATGGEMDNIPDLIFTGENNGDELGEGLDLFDIDHDGFSDILITARKWGVGGSGTFQGRAYLYWGSSRATMDTVVDVIFTGEADAESTFGGNRVYAGYINDDPYGDIIVSAFDYYRLSQYGCAYLFYGGSKKSMDVVYDRMFFERDIGPLAVFGKEAKLCDLNNDGFDDVVLGAYAYNNFQGRVSIYWNKRPSSTEGKSDWDTTSALAGTHTLQAKVNPIARKENSTIGSRTVAVSIEPAASGKPPEPLKGKLQTGPGTNLISRQHTTPSAKKPKTSFTAAAVDGDIEQVKSHLAWGTDINEKTISGDTALHYAIKYRHQDVAELLIANGADINGPNRDGETPAHLAIKADQKEVLDLLLAKGATVSPVHLAAYKGDLATVRKFIEGKAPVNVVGEGGLTLLHAAASGGQRETAAYLISHGADGNALDKKKQTPLFCAAAAGHRAIVRLLIDKGADLNPEREPDRWTPLYAAVEFGYKDIVELLIARGSNVNIKTLTGDTPLHAVALKGDRESAGLLIAQGADLNVRNARWLNTPLFLAVVAGYRDIVELLATKGANLNTKNTDGFAPLHYAVSPRRLSGWESRIGESSTPSDLAITELLVSHGADVNIKSDNGATPLSLAKRGGKAEIIELLKKHGAKE